MKNSADKFADIISKTHFDEPKYNVIHNVDVSITSDISDIKNKLIDQLTKPVQWVNTMEYIKQYQGIFIECGPKNVLSGLAKANAVDNIYSSSSDNFFDKIEQIL